MEKERIGGGLLVAVGVVAPWTAQMIGLHLGTVSGIIVLTLCIVAAVVGLILIFWPKRKYEGGEDEKVWFPEGFFVADDSSVINADGVTLENLRIDGPLAKAARNSEISMKGLQARDTYSNSGTNYGHMGPVNNFGKPQFELSQAQIGSVLGRIPPARAVVLVVVGNDRAQEMGRVLCNALQRAGHTVECNQVGVMGPPPDKPLTIEERDGRTTVILAPDA